VERTHGTLTVRTTRQGKGTAVAGEHNANVIPLYANARRAASRREATHDVDASLRRHPSTLSEPHRRAPADDQIAPVIPDIDQPRSAPAAFGKPKEMRNEVVQRIAAVAGFLCRRLSGDYAVDEFGFDPHFTEGVAMPVLRTLFSSWFRVEVTGIDNLPPKGPALVVANHAGVLPLDGLMISVAVPDTHPAHRVLRLLAADMMFDMPLLGQAARKAGATIACTPDAHRLLARGELTAVFPEGYTGLGKHFRDRYTLRPFGHGGFVPAALHTKAPIVPCSIVGSEEIYPMIADIRPLARLLGLPYFPITPFFPLGGPAGLIPLPSKWHIEFGTPIPTVNYDESAANDPMVTFELAEQLREIIQHTVYRLVGRRGTTPLSWALGRRRAHRGGVPPRVSVI
jgi:1-acyl-sn-glycerol-3-phosphate acyltransferase